MNSPAFSHVTHKAFWRLYLVVVFHTPCSSVGKGFTELLTLINS